MLLTEKPYGPASGLFLDEAMLLAIAGQAALLQIRRDAEFLATAIELFFELPRELKREFPSIYTVLSGYLALDPAAWH